VKQFSIHHWKEEGQIESEKNTIFFGQWPEWPGCQRDKTGSSERAWNFIKPADVSFIGDFITDAEVRDEEENQRIIFDFGCIGFGDSCCGPRGQG
jgi:hypothetical protein